MEIATFDAGRTFFGIAPLRKHTMAIECWVCNLHLQSEIKSKVELKFVHFKNTVTYAILISLKTMIIFDNTSSEFVLMSADVLLKMVIVLR